jgi:hypothetical protein
VRFGYVPVIVPTVELPFVTAFTVHVRPVFVVPVTETVIAKV